MKKPFKCCVLVSAMVATLASAEKKAEGPVFDFLQTIETELVRGEVYQVDLPEEVFDGCKAFPQDFRVLDTTGFAWPFVVHTPQESSSLATMTTRTLREEQVGGEHPYIETELQLFPNRLAGGLILHNLVTIRTTGENYTRKVEIFGETAKGVQKLGAGQLVDFGPAANAAQRRIRYQDSQAEKLVVRIYADEPGQALSFKVTQLSVGHQRFRPGEIAGVPMTVEQEMAPGEAAGWSSAVYDSGFVSRPIDDLRFDVAAPSFIRATRIFGRNNPSNSWQLVTEAVLQKSPEFPVTDVSLRRCTFRWIKVEIFHGEEAPLQLRSLQAFATPRRLIFEVMTEGPGMLRYGTSDSLIPAPAPTRRMKQADLRTLPVVTLGPRKALAELQQTSRAMNKMFYFSIGGVLGLIALMIFVRRAFT